MITEFLIDMVYNSVAFIANIFTILPDVTLPSFIATALSDISPYYSAVDGFLPVDTLLLILSVVELPFLSAIGLYYVIRWGYQKIPFIK
jgi:hypothetical protein